MQDIRKYIDIVSEQPTPQVGDAIDLEFGENTASISAVASAEILIPSTDDDTVAFPPVSSRLYNCICDIEQHQYDLVEKKNARHAIDNDESKNPPTTAPAMLPSS